LYRYCCFDKDDRNIGIIENSLLPCPSPQRFNDPFDCRIRLNFNIKNEEQLKNYFRDMVNHFFPNISEQEKEKKILFFVENKETAVDYFNKIYEGYCDNNLGIFSLSARRNHFLLWSHYTCGHHGFSIEFSTKKLLRYLKSKYDPESHLVHLDKIKYSNSYPEIFPGPDMYNITLVKSKVWEYEKEYRLIFYKGVDKSVRVSPEVIHSIILGCEIEEENEAKVIKLLREKRNNIILYKAKKKSYKFGLDYIQINY
jgi:hypothetical protein